MNFELSFKLNEKLYIRNPEATDLGKQIIKSSIDLIYELGFEHFTFKKLAQEIHATEASIYRYFENKHRLLLYILNWYWYYMEFLILFKLNNVNDNESKINTILDLLTEDLPESAGKFDYNKKFLNRIVIVESSKTYLIKEIEQVNREQAFKPYKDLCAKIAEVIKAFKPDYKYPLSLSSTIIETAHQQQYFSEYLPKLTDVASLGKIKYANKYLKDLVFNILK